MQIFRHQFELTYTCGYELTHKFSSHFVFYPPHRNIFNFIQFSMFSRVDDAIMWCCSMYVYKMALFHTRKKKCQFYFTSDAIQKVACHSIVSFVSLAFCMPILLIRIFVYHWLLLPCFKLVLPRMCYYGFWCGIPRIQWIWIRFMYAIFDLLRILQRNTRRISWGY